jgi:hypothetical protein
MRAKINSHLDTLEQNIMKELDDAEVKIKSKIDNLLKQLYQESKTVEGIQSDITGGCITDIICAWIAFIVLITTDAGLVSIETDPNDVIADILSFIFSSMLHFKLSCCRHPSSDKAIMVK